MQLASIVSERFGFKIPSGYARMTEAGLLASPPARARSGEATPSRKNSKKADAKNPSSRRHAASAPRTRALATTDVQWLTTEEIAVRIERHGGRASWRPRWPADFVFIPFAERRSGGQWGWAPSLGEPGAAEPPVLFIAHDSEDARVVAPTFAAFLFRMTLESLAQCAHDPSEMSLGERVSMLRGSARAVLDFLPAELSARLDRVLELPIRKVMVRTLREKNGKFFRTSDTTHLSLVGTDWAARIVREELEDSRVDQPLRIDV
jgi:hypothetical protein